MSDLIPDSQFLTPTQIRALPCTTADRYLKSVAEVMDIISVCQNSLNPSIIEITFSINGVYLYTPVCEIWEVDADTSYRSNAVTAPLVVGFPTHPPLPINTNCAIGVYTLAFNFAQAIPLLANARFIKFNLKMLGQLPGNLGLVGYPNNIVVQQTYSWRKGLTANPISLIYTEAGKLVVYFEFNESVDCSCFLQCITPSGVGSEVSFCEDKKQKVIIDRGPLSGDPSNILIQIRDSRGNNNDITIQALLDVIPAKPTVYPFSSPKRVEVNISHLANNGEQLKGNIAYQVWKYEGSASSAKIWKDWSYRKWQTFVDMDVIPGRTYGYAVRYLGEYKDKSRLSDWTSVAAI